MSARTDFQSAASYAGAAHAAAGRLRSSTSDEDIKKLAEALAQMAWAIRQLANGLARNP